MVVRYVHNQSVSDTGANASHECVFLFTLDQVREACEVVSQSHWWKAPRGPGAPVVNTWRRHHPHRLIQWLAEEAQRNDVIEPQVGHWRSWTHVAWQLLSTMCFTQVSCT